MNETAQQIEKQLKQLLTTHLENPVDLDHDTNLVRDLGLESVQVMEFVVDIEDHYDLSIDLKSLAEVHTMGDMTAVVLRLMQDQE